MEASPPRPTEPPQQQEEAPEEEAGAAAAEGTRRASRSGAELDGEQEGGRETRSGLRKQQALLPRAAMPKLTKRVLESGLAQTAVGALLLALLPAPTTVTGGSRSMGKAERTSAAKPGFAKELAAVMLGAAAGGSKKREPAPPPIALAVLLAEPRDALPEALRLVCDALPEPTPEQLADIAFSRPPEPGWLRNQRRGKEYEEALVDVLLFEDTQSGTYDALLKTERPAAAGEGAHLLELNLGDTIAEASGLPEAEKVRAERTRCLSPRVASIAHGAHVASLHR